jgi:2-amino-4-hydroxy-6-hydroxymethyldihydropteridine diphosphokinase
MSTVYLGLGSNLGDREENLQKALSLLADHPQITVVKTSSFYNTAPVGFVNQPDFLNAVTQIETSLSPRELRDATRHIESQMGRQRTIRWGPRVIDIDILLYDNERIEEDDLKIPHPEMMKRRFVLEPLAEIAPDLVLPDGRTAREAAESSGP